MSDARSPTRPFHWSVRREVWENRSIYIAPLVVAGIALFGFFVTVGRTVRHLREVPSLEAAKQLNVVFAPYGIISSMILATGFIVGMFYCLDALNGERRDRSLLFWKSLPVSDRTAILAKASIPLVVLPLLTYVVALAAQAVVFTMTTFALSAYGLNPVTLLWRRLPMFQAPLVLLYGLAAHVLWFAPIYAWLLLVSAWARRAAVLWALLPFFAAFVLETMSFGTSSRRLASLLKYRLQGAMREGFSIDVTKRAVTRLADLDPIGFVTAPGLWIGLLFAAACLAGAVRLRRNRGPI